LRGVRFLEWANEHDHKPIREKQNVPIDNNGGNALGEGELGHRISQVVDAWSRSRSYKRQPRNLPSESGPAICLDDRGDADDGSNVDGEPLHGPAYMGPRLRGAWLEWDRLHAAFAFRALIKVATEAAQLSSEFGL
jgi:hypothetical protein